MLTNEQNAWVQTQLKDRGLTLTGSVALTHERPWSNVATVPTGAGRLFFKITRPELRFEVRLTEQLSRWGMPVPEVVAADAEEGWLLLRDSGQSLRSLLQADGDIERWHTAVTQYAHMQIALADRAEALLATGLFDRRLDHLPALYAGLLHDRPALMIGEKDGLTAAEFSRLQEFAPQFAGLCRQLAALGIPETLHHDDFHDNNIFVRDGRYSFADWGEACLAHPFFSLIIVLRSAAYTLRLQPDDPALAALRDTYLRQWQDFATWAELRQAFALAHHIGMFNRALTWHAVLRLMDEAERATEADAVPGWLQEFLAQG